MQKNCTRCDVSKPLTLEYFPQRKTRDGEGWRWDSWCRDCYKANTKRSQTKDPERKRQRDKEWREKNSERYHAQAKLRYAQMSVPEKEKARNNARRHHRMLKHNALAAYATGREIACECCNESVEAFLTLDHRQNNGRAHREEIGKRAMGVKFYQYLRDENYPQEFDLAVMCFNCNTARHWSPNRQCPHELTRQELTGIPPEEVSAYQAP